MSDDYQIDGAACPRCGSCDTRSRSCAKLDCDDGWCDEHEYDAINFAAGECLTRCNECLGYGLVRWCASCGLDLNQHAYLTAQETEDA